MLSGGAEISKAEAERAANPSSGNVTDALARSDRVEIRGLCSFYVKQYAAYTGRNPETGEEVHRKWNQRMCGAKTAHDMSSPKRSREPVDLGVGWGVNVSGASVLV